MRRTKEQAEETRRAILKVAEAIFLDRGPESVSLDEIAAAAGVTRGAVHWHFRNKRGLLSAIRDEMRMPVQELAERLAADTTVEPLESLGEVASTIFRRLQADPRRRKILKVLLHLDRADDAEEPNDGDTFQQRVRGSLEAVFEAMARTRPLPPPWTPSSAALAFQAVIDGLVSEWARGKTDFALVPDAEAVVQAILVGWQDPTKRSRFKGNIDQPSCFED
jgi:TetR/AcrR family acrAB operon transcriptional repressor